MIMYNIAMEMFTGRLLVGRAELHQPRNLGEVALGERAVLSLALVPSVCSGSTPSKKRSTHSLSRPVSRHRLSILSVVYTVILLGGSIL
jgi:hypothetical protein